MTSMQKQFSLKSTLYGAVSSYKLISLFNFITTLPKTNIYPKNCLVLQPVFVWWGNEKTICLLFVLAGHDEEQNFMSKMGALLTMSGICQCLCVGMLWFPAGNALVREAEQEGGSTWRTLWLILNKLSNKVVLVHEGGSRSCSGCLGFALVEMQQLIRKLSSFSCCPMQSLCQQTPQQSFALQSHWLTHLCSPS